MWTYNHTDELYHHGVKGQRWGIRRYQNPDGSLTPAGKKREQERLEVEERWESIKRGEAAEKEYQEKRSKSYADLQRRYQKFEDEYYKSDKYKKYLKSEDFNPAWDHAMAKWESMYKRWEKDNTKLKILGEKKMKDLEAYENHRAEKRGLAAMATVTAFLTAFGLVAMARATRGK